MPVATTILQMKATIKLSAGQLYRSPVLLLAFGFGAGLTPRAPGTVGTLVAIPIYLLLARLPVSAYLLSVMLISLAGVWICREASRRLGVHDHPGIVWDEIAGFLVTMLPVAPDWIWIAVGFGLFRLFDIWKPWPISWVDRRLSGGTGIMLDDLLAGALAAVILFLLTQGFA